MPDNSKGVEDDLQAIAEAQLEAALATALNRCARHFMSCPMDDISDAVKFALNTSVESMGVSQAALYLEEEDWECKVSKHWWSTGNLTAADKNQLIASCDKQFSAAAGAGHILLPCNKIGLNFAQAIVLAVPLRIHEKFEGGLLYVFDEPPGISVFSLYQDHLQALAKMVNQTLCRCREIKELTTAKERLRQGQIYANIGTWEWSLIDGSLFWSEKIPELFGFSQNEVVSKKFFQDALYVDDRALVKAAIDGAINEGIQYDIEHRIVWPDGSVRWVLERGAVARSEDGTPVKMLGIVQDINEHKLAQLALEEKQWELQQAKDMTKVGHWYADAKTGVTRASDQVYQIFGLEQSRDQFSLEFTKQVVHPEDEHYIDIARKSLLENGYYESTHRIVRPDGEVRYVYLVGQADYAESGQIQGIYAAVQDITHRVELEEQLRASEQLFRFAVEGAGDAVWNWNLQTNTVDHTRMCTSFLGYEQDEIPKDPDILARLMHPEDIERVGDIHFRCEAGEYDNYKTEMRMRCKDGSYKWILCRTTVIDRDEDGRAIHMIGIHSDIAEQKAAEVELMAARDEAERASRAKSEFLSHMSHELRTPMNAILGFGQLLEQDKSLSPENSDNISEILHAGRHLLELINEVLDLAKVEAGKISLSVETVALVGLIRDVVTLVEPLAKKRDIDIVLEDVTGLAITADQMRMKQVLINVLSNAIKYNQQGGSVTISAQELADEETGGEKILRLEVVDTGVGIEPEALDVIFQPFNRYRADDSDVEGTGIGLALTKALVEMMDGKIGVSSQTGSGSRFWIDLPAAQLEAEAGVGFDDRALDQVGFAGEGIKTVLYIDDNPVNLKLVQHILSSIPNISLVEAHNGEMGVNIAQALQPDLMLVDISMPGLDGYQVLNILKRKPGFENKPFVAVTANAMPSDVARGKAAGFIEYLSKPFDISEFREVVCRLLEEGVPAAAGKH